MKAQGGGDPTKAVIAEYEKQARNVMADAISMWLTESQQRIMEAAEGRSTDPPEGDSENKEYRRNNNLHELAQEFTGIHEEGNSWNFSNTHFAAKWHEWGARPHEIKAKQARMLAFPWADGPDELLNDEGWYFAESVQHPGTPAIGFMRWGREEARQYLIDQGFEVRSYG